jgi:hypothetical protein
MIEFVVETKIVFACISLRMVMIVLFFASPFCFGRGNVFLCVILLYRDIHIDVSYVVSYDTAVGVNFQVAYVLCKVRQFLSILGMRLAILYVGVLILLTTGRIGIPGLRNFRWVCSVDGVGCFWMRCLNCCLLIMELHLCKFCCTCCSYLSVGFV